MHRNGPPHPRTTRQRPYPTLFTRLLVGALTALAAAACSAGADSRGNTAAAATTTRDSAGLRIVENSRPMWGDSARWRIADEPALSIGVVEGDSMLLLSQVTGALRLADGRIVVADGGASQLRFFDDSGRFITVAGGRGEGPGEFQFLGRIWLRPNDTIAATDILPRVTYFDSSGQYLHSVPIMPPAGMRQAFVVSQSRDGSYLAWGSTRGYDQAPPGQIFQDTIQIWRLNADGAGGSPVARVPAQERWILQTGTSTTYPFLPFSAPHSIAVGLDRFAAGDGRASQVGLWRTDGTEGVLLRWSSTRSPLTPDLLARFRQERLANTPDPNQRRRLERFLAEAPVPDSLPLYQSLLLDDSGHLWVEDYRPFWDEAATWQIFAPDGEWLGSINTPPRLRILHIGEDFVLGRWLDENDVQSVRLYRLVR